MKINLALTACLSFCSFSPAWSANGSTRSEEVFAALQRSIAEVLRGESALQALTQIDGVSGFPRFLPFSISDVEVTKGTVIDITLQQGLLITGNITAPGFFVQSLIAFDSTGVAYPGVISRTDSRYGVAVPPGDTYTLSFCLLSMVAGGPSATLEDQVSVAGEDVMRDETAAAPVAHRVSGTITGRDPAFPFAIAVFASADVRVGSTALLGPAGDYSASLPDGVFAAGLLQLVPDGSRIVSQRLGTVEVAGADVIFNGVAPSTAHLTGTVSRPDGPIPSGSAAQAVEAGTSVGRGCGNVVFNGTLGPIDPSSGSYSLALSTGVTYDVTTVLAIVPPDPPRSAGTWSYLTPAIDFPGDLSFDVAYPAAPDLTPVRGTVNPAGYFLVHGRSNNMLSDGLGGRIFFDRYTSMSTIEFIFGAMMVGFYNIDTQIDIDHYP